ncbi:MAG: NDP-sugar synthase [Thermoleophilia bacterium]|nr:NDP-sugar synthase [Thermoleophilia bacterium]
MKAMVLAAGLGTRLMPLTGSISKPMAPIVNRPVLYHILRLIKQHGYHEAVANLHYHPHAITNYFGRGQRVGIDLRYSLEPELMGTAGGVKCVQRYLEDDTFLVISGDALTDMDLTRLLAQHREAGGIATLALKQVDDPSRFGVVVRDKDGRILGFQEKPAPGEELSNLCNCGIYVFEPAIFDYIPKDTFYDFGKQLFRDFISKDIPFFGFEIDGYWNDVGSLEQYRIGNFDALTGKVNVEIPGKEISPGIYVGEGTTIADSATLRPPILLGDHCRVGENASLTGPLVIGDHSVIEGDAALEGVIKWRATQTGAGAKVLGGIIGRGAYLRDDVRISDGVVIGDRCVIGAGSVLDEEVRLEPFTVIEADSHVQ